MFVIYAAYFGSYLTMLSETHSATDVPRYRKRCNQSINHFYKNLN